MKPKMDMQAMESDISLFTPKKAWQKTPLIGEGAYNGVYRLSEKDVVKVNLWREETDIQRFEHECDIAQECWRNGIAVPEPRGIFNVELFNEKNYGTKLGFVMEYIPGTRLIDLMIRPTLIPELDRIEDLWNSEIDKARNLKLNLKDVRSYNAIWCPERDKVYLIDFEAWERK